MKSVQQQQLYARGGKSINNIVQLLFFYTKYFNFFSLRMSLLTVNDFSSSTTLKTKQALFSSLTYDHSKIPNKRGGLKKKTLTESKEKRKKKLSLNDAF